MSKVQINIQQCLMESLKKKSSYEKEENEWTSYKMKSKNDLER